MSNSSLDFNNFSLETQKKILRELREEKLALQKHITEIENQHLREHIECLEVDIKALNSEKSRLEKELSEYSEEFIRSRINKVLHEEKEIEAEPVNSSNSHHPIFFSDFKDSDTEEDFKELSEESNSVEKAVSLLLRGKGSRG